MANHNLQLNQNAISQMVAEGSIVASLYSDDVKEAFRIIDDEKEELAFFMRTKDQQEYAPSIVKFVDERYSISYKLRDMAALCTRPEVSNFLADIARRMTYNLRVDGTFPITKEEMNMVVKFIKRTREAYAKCDYVDLTKLVDKQ